MKVKLRKPPPKWLNPDYHWWKASAPFVVNPRGVLIHRPRFVSTRLRDGKPDKDTCHYYCNGANYSGPVQFFDDPPKDRLLCAECERRAVSSGEQTADQLAGRHVHIGRMVPKRTCCTDENN